MSISLFDPWQLGSLQLRNRIVMAPMTRNRADADGVLPEYVAEYYRQRAGAGLIISEASQPSIGGRGYHGTPGMHDDRQSQAWSKIAGAVHEAGGVMFCQLMHTGRIGHTSLLPEPWTLVAPSAIAANWPTTTADRQEVDCEVPKELTFSEIEGIIDDFASAAERAIAAGMDGVELHGANGYLIHQFIADCTNHREDSYGGTPHDRARFAVELTAEVARRIGPQRVGLRLSPYGKFNDMNEVDNDDAYLKIVEELNELGIAYLHVLRRRSTPLHEQLRANWKSTFMLNTGYFGDSDKAELQQILANGDADLISVGRYFISNPDLVDRWRNDWPLAPWDEDTFYTPGPEGLIDYPTYQP